MSVKLCQPTQQGYRAVFYSHLHTEDTVAITVFVVLVGESRPFDLKVSQLLLIIALDIQLPVSH